jgi:hypothetical protein
MSTRSPHCTWKWCTRLLLTLLVVDRSLAHVHHHDHVISERDLSDEQNWCGAASQPQKDMANAQHLVQTWLDFKNQNKMGDGGIRKMQVTADIDIVVPVCFHVIRPSEDTFLDTDTLQVQLDALNLAYSTGSCCDDTLDWW